MVRKLLFRNSPTDLVRCKSITLYGDEISPPVRFVQMTADMLGIQYKFKKVDLFKQENKQDFFKKINPLQKVPALKVGDTVITDSHAIAMFLCENSDGQTLYPDDPIIRPIVQQMMFFNSSTLFNIDSTIYSNFFAGSESIDVKLIRDWTLALDYLEYQLRKHEWLAYDKMSLCDLCCAATVSTLQLLIPPTEKHKKVNRWLKRLEEIPCHSINKIGLDRLQIFIDQIKDVAH